MPFINIIDIGEEVLCDYCNTAIEDDSIEGGCFVGSYAVCPACTRDKGLKSSDEEPVDFIQGSFRRAVLKKRDGDNTIKIWTA